MRRSAAPSFQSGGPGKRIKFSSPLLSSNKKCSPTPLPLRELKDAEQLFNSKICSSDKENIDDGNTQAAAQGQGKSNDFFQSSPDPEINTQRQRVPKFNPPKQSHKINGNINSDERVTCQSRSPVIHHSVPSSPKLTATSHQYQRKTQTFSGPKFVNQLQSNVDASNSCNKNGDKHNLGHEVSYYRVMYTKFSKKKHKTWEGDGIIIVRNHSVELCDQDNKSLGKKSQCKMSEITNICNGSTIFIGGKEVLVDDEISADSFNSGSCFSSHSNIPPTNHAKSNISKGFLCPQKDGNTTATTTAKRTPRHDPNCPSAVVLARETIDTVAVVLDPYLRDKMRPHQIEGVRFLYRCVMGGNTSGCGAVLADDMGLGKTLQCISLMWTLLKQGPAGAPVCKKCLIITPSSLVMNWKNEFKKWLGDERVKVWALAAGESSVSDFTNSPLYSVLVISYEMFRKSIQSVLKVDWGIVVCDEGHRLKNVAAKIGEALCQLPCKRRVILTGTPVQNNLKEFYTLVNFVNPGVFGSSRAFNNVFAEAIQLSQLPTATADQQNLGKTRSEELSKITSQFIIRRTSEVNEKYLPPKEERILFCKPSTSLIEKYTNILDSCRGNGSSSADNLELICKLKKVCNHPCLVQEEREGTQEGTQEVSVSESTKLLVTSSLVRDHVSRGEKVVLVSSYTQTLDILGYLCDSLGLEYHRLDGKTPQVKRQSMVDFFNYPQDKRKVFLLSSKAGGVGLNLVGGNIILLYDIDWNPANDHQAMARVWRDGQTKPVVIYRLLTTGTIEEKIFQRQIMKQGLSTCVIDKADAQCSFSQAELRDIFSCNFTTTSTTHDLLKCNCNGTYRPRDGTGVGPLEEEEGGVKHGIMELMGPLEEEEGGVKHGIMELMGWQHAQHTDPNITFSFIKTSTFS